MTTDITELAQSLKAAAVKATPGEWVVQLGDEVYATDDGVDYEQVAIATLDARDADFIALANPANILALVEALEKAQQHIARQEQIILNQDESLSIRRGELEKAQKSNEFLKGQLSELANFNPDWDKLEASYESWREIAAELLIAKDRIAELEESHAQVIHARDHYKALWRESLKGARTVTVKLPDDAEHDIMAPVAAYLSEKFKWDGSATRWDGRKEYDVLAGRVKYALRMVIRRAAGIREAE